LIINIFSCAVNQRNTMIVLSASLSFCDLVATFFATILNSESFRNRNKDTKNYKEKNACWHKLHKIN